MIRIHREGNLFVAIGLGELILWIALSILFDHWIWQVLLLLSMVECLFVLNFFRHPGRKIPEKGDQLVYAPADGKVVTVEVIGDPDIGEGAVQISIFMSPLDVHVNRIPCRGRVLETRYHPGKYLVAWHPKSSSLNERQETLMDCERGKMRIKQIAGAVARRIKCYAEPGEMIEQGAELGFIKFGSRVDVILPDRAEVLVELNQKVRSNRTVLARW